MKKFLILFALFTGMNTAMADNLVVESVVIPQGGKVVVPVKYHFDEVSEYGGYQFELTLPEGVETEKDENGNPVFENGDGLATVFTPFSSHDAEAGNDIFTSLPTGNPMKDTEGVLIYLTFTVDEDLEVGTELAGQVNKISFGKSDGVTTVPFADVDFSITIGEPADTRVILDENTTTAPAAAEGVNVRVRRTINAGEWATICLPFAMTEAQVAEAFGDDVQVGDFVSWSSEENDEGDIVAISLSFESVKAMEANRPYIIKVMEDVAEFTVDGVDISPNEEPTVQVGKKKAERGYLTGTYTVADVPENDFLLVDGQFAYSDGTVQTKAFTAYFELADVLADTANASENIGLVFGGEKIPTRINFITRDGSGVYYNLNGQRVEPQKKGLYIANGKKAVVR